MGDNSPKRLEDVRIKIPALLHLSRLGYDYIIPKGNVRDRETNILPEILKESVERINGIELTEDNFHRLMTDLRYLLDADDLGLGFYATIRDGWNGLKLLDYDQPKANCFQAGTEITCTRGKSRFRPDIMIFVNGLPLAIMEVKDPEQREDLQAEYERMCERLRKDAFRRFLQVAQIWLFSNDRRCDDQAVLPREGTFFTTLSGSGFSVYSAQGKSMKGSFRLPRLSEESERLILADNSLMDMKANPDYRRLISADTPTHRMLTGLLAPERFLFLLRYGIRYIREKDETGQARLQKRILTWDQLENLDHVNVKIRRGFRNWTIPCPSAGGRTIMAAAAFVYLRKKMPGCRLFWITLNEWERKRAEEAFRQQELIPDDICFPAAEDIRRGIFQQAELTKTAACRIFFLPAITEQYRTENSILSRLRTWDPAAVIIRMGEAEKHEKENCAYLLQCADGTLYCGWTNDLGKRVKLHNAGRGAKYTRSRLPVKLVYWESCATKKEAMSREWQIKQMNRKEKERLIGKKEGTS